MCPTEIEGPVHRPQRGIADAAASSGEVHRVPALHGESGNPVDLLAIGGAAVVFAPCGFLSVAEKLGTSDMVVVADLGTAKPAEVLFRPVR